MTAEHSTLAANPCRSLCAWSATEQQRLGAPLFRCAGCGSEWVAGEAWTPVNADGTVPAEVAAQRAQ